MLGLLALLLIATRVHRLRRRLAVKAAQEAMEFHNEARLRALLEHAGDIVTVVGTDLTVRWQAASITRILGHGTSALLGKPLTSLVHPDEVVLVERFLASGLAGSSVQGLTIRLRHADRSWRAFDVVANNRVADPAIRGLVLSMRDVTERKALEDELRHQAFHDSLTGLANRSLFEDRLSHAVAIAQRRRAASPCCSSTSTTSRRSTTASGTRAATISCARWPAASARSCAPTDTAARLGGDEFACCWRRIVGSGRPLVARPDPRRP